MNIKDLKAWYKKHGKKITWVLVLIALVAPSLVSAWSLRQVRKYEARINTDEEFIRSLLKGELPLARICTEDDIKCFVPALQHLAKRIGALEQSDPQMRFDIPASLGTPEDKLTPTPEPSVTP